MIPSRPISAIGPFASDTPRLRCMSCLLQGGLSSQERVTLLGRGYSPAVAAGSPGLDRGGRSIAVREAPTRRAGPGSERDHAADPVLALHQLEAPVDLVERQRMRQERRHVEPAVEREPDELRHLVAALDPAERGA